MHIKNNNNNTHLFFSGKEKYSLVKDLMQSPVVIAGFKEITVSARIWSTCSFEVLSDSIILTQAPNKFGSISYRDKSCKNEVYI